MIQDGDPGLSPLKLQCLERSNITSDCDTYLFAFHLCFSSAFLPFPVFLLPCFFFSCFPKALVAPRDKSSYFKLGENKTGTRKLEAVFPEMDTRLSQHSMCAQSPGHSACGRLLLMASCPKAEWVWDSFAARTTLWDSKPACLRTPDQTVRVLSHTVSLRGQGRHTTKKASSVQELPAAVVGIPQCDGG